jgi:hypothetical protein
MENNQMLERDQIVIIAGAGKRYLTDEEWELFQVRLANGEVKFSSYMDNMEKYFDNMCLTEIVKYEDFEPIKEDNHSWKKSNKHKHPAFK